MVPTLSGMSVLLSDHVLGPELASGRTWESEFDTFHTYFPEHVQSQLRVEVLGIEN